MPVIGGRLKGAFDTVADGGRALQHAGQVQQDAVHTLAVWLGVIVAVLPIVWLLFRYLPGRIGWIREATAATRLRQDPQLFALRALANRPLVELAAVSGDPMGDYRAGKFRALAAFELQALGLEPL